MKSYLFNRNKWTIACVCWLCGVIILYSLFVLDAEDRETMLLCNSLFTVGMVAAFLLTSGKIRQWGLILFALMAIPVSIIETGWFLIDRSPLIRNQFWVIFDSNPAEASGLLSMIQLWQWVMLGIYVAVSVALLVVAVRASDGKSNRLLSMAGLLVAVMLVLIPPLRHNVPCVNFYNSYRGYIHEVRKAESFYDTRQDLSGRVYNELSDSSATVIVIIGESVCRSHCSLYGYCRPTTPKLAARRDLIVYQNVRSHDFLTQIVLPQILTFADENNLDARWDSPTLPELLNEAGWCTYWFDPYEGRNNTSNTIPTSFSAIAKLCSKYYLSNESEQYDGMYLDHLLSIVQDSTVSHKAVFLHLIGSHFPYERRYPHNFKYFESSTLCSPFLNRLSARQKEVINAYDDAVRYNDWFVDSVLNVMDRQPGCCAVLYFPDHGEEVYDLDFYAGRSFNHITRNLYDIPCVFWQNKSYSNSHPLYLDPSVSYCTVNMIHSLLDLFAVSYDQKDTCRSMFRQVNTRVPLRNTAIGVEAQ